VLFSFSFLLADFVFNLHFKNLNLKDKPKISFSGATMTKPPFFVTKCRFGMTKRFFEFFDWWKWGHFWRFFGVILKKNTENHEKNLLGSSFYIRPFTGLQDFKITGYFSTFDILHFKFFLCVLRVSVVKLAFQSFHLYLFRIKIMSSIPLFRANHD